MCFTSMGPSVHVDENVDPMLESVRVQYDGRDVQINNIRCKIQEWANQNKTLFYNLVMPKMFQTPQEKKEVLFLENWAHQEHYKFKQHRYSKQTTEHRFLRFFLHLHHKRKDEIVAKIKLNAELKREDKVEFMKQIIENELQKHRDSNNLYMESYDAEWAIPIKKCPDLLASLYSALTSLNSDLYLIYWTSNWQSRLNFWTNNSPYACGPGVLYTKFYTDETDPVTHETEVPFKFYPSTFFESMDVLTTQEYTEISRKVCDLGFQKYCDEHDAIQCSDFWQRTTNECIKREIHYAEEEQKTYCQEHTDVTFRLDPYTLFAYPQTGQRNSGIGIKYNTSGVLTIRGRTGLNGNAEKQRQERIQRANRSKQEQAQDHEDNELQDGETQHAEHRERGKSQKYEKRQAHANEGSPPRRDIRLKTRSEHSDFPTPSKTMTEAEKKAKIEDRKTFLKKEINDLLQLLPTLEEQKTETIVGFKEVREFLNGLDPELRNQYNDMRRDKKSWRASRLFNQNINKKSLKDLEVLDSSIDQCQEACDYVVNAYQKFFQNKLNKEVFEIELLYLEKEETDLFQNQRIANFESDKTKQLNLDLEAHTKEYHISEPSFFNMIKQCIEVSMRRFRHSAPDALDDAGDDKKTKTTVKTHHMHKEAEKMKKCLRQCKHITSLIKWSKQSFEKLLDDGDETEIRDKSNKHTKEQMTIIKFSKTICRDANSTLVQLKLEYTKLQKTLLNIQSTLKEINRNIQKEKDYYQVIMSERIQGYDYGKGFDDLKTECEKEMNVWNNSQLDNFAVQIRQQMNNILHSFQQGAVKFERIKIHSAEIKKRMKNIDKILPNKIRLMSKAMNSLSRIWEMLPKEFLTKDKPGLYASKQLKILKTHEQNINEWMIEIPAILINFSKELEYHLKQLENNDTLITEEEDSKREIIKHIKDKLNELSELYSNLFFLQQYYDISQMFLNKVLHSQNWSKVAYSEDWHKTFKKSQEQITKEDKYLEDENLRLTKYIDDINNQGLGLKNKDADENVKTVRKGTFCILAKTFQNKLFEKMTQRTYDLCHIQLTDNISGTTGNIKGVVSNKNPEGGKGTMTYTCFQSYKFLNNLFAKVNAHDGILTEFHKEEFYSKIRKSDTTTQSNSALNSTQNPFFLFFDPI